MSAHLPNVQQIVERELSQLDFSNGRTKAQPLAHFYMAPTVREMFERSLPDQTFQSANAVIQAIPSDAWTALQNQIQHGSPESHYLESRAAHFNILGQTPGFGHITESEQDNPRSSS
jgi:hypothetical protein